MMNINSLCKRLPQDDFACQAVALQMALDYFLQRNIDRDLLFEYCRARGAKNNALSWGTLLGAVQYDSIYAVLISLNPHNLNNYDDFADDTGMTIGGAEKFVIAIKNEAVQHERIQLVKWKDDYRYLPQYCVNHEIAVIPSMDKMYNRVHSIILRKFEGDKVYYNDPNSPQPRTDIPMPNAQFFNWWLNSTTDNDLILISTEKLDIDKITRQAFELYA